MVDFSFTPEWKIFLYFIYLFIYFRKLIEKAKEIYLKILTQHQWVDATIP